MENLHWIILFAFSWIYFWVCSGDHLPHGQHASTHSRLGDWDSEFSTVYDIDKFIISKGAYSQVSLISPFIWGICAH